jgi:hypothetical protein
MSGTDYTQTPNLGLFKPIPDQDVGQWGTHWNVNADTLDTWLAPTAAGKFLPRTGGTMTGPLTLSPDAPSGALDAATKHYVDTHAGSGGGGISDAPIDGLAYGRQDASWSRVLAITGDLLDGGNF